VEPGYQVPFAQSIRREAGIKTAAVGLISDARQAEAILADGSADLVVLGRMALWDPYWPHHAADELGLPPELPIQYARAGIYAQSDRAPPTARKSAGGEAKPRKQPLRTR
jgi:2,4-dienoyl-CoA reductase-like NADH-dependent reductase (Old Yellow Enzyme family)